MDLKKLQYVDFLKRFFVKYDYSRCFSLKPKRRFHEKKISSRSTLNYDRRSSSSNCSS